MRKPIVGSSWKIHIHSVEMGEKLAAEIHDLVGEIEDTEIFILPAFPLLSNISKILEGGKIKWGAQNMAFEEKGGYTGEVSPQMLKELGCTYVEIGHAERRTMFQEGNREVHKKVRLAIDYQMNPIVCIGESERDKGEGIGNLRLHTQILWALGNLEIDEMKQVVLAYEPVWAIGKAEAASVDHVENIHGYIRHMVKKEFGKDVADTISIIYGGSVRPENADELTKQKNVDGLFVGRFGLKADAFQQIIKATRSNKIKQIL